MCVTVSHVTVFSPVSGWVPVEWVRLGLAGGALNGSEGWEGEANQVKPLS